MNQDSILALMKKIMSRPAEETITITALPIKNKDSLTIDGTAIIKTPVREQKGEPMGDT